MLAPEQEQLLLVKHPSPVRASESWRASRLSPGSLSHLGESLFVLVYGHESGETRFSELSDST